MTGPLYEDTLGLKVIEELPWDAIEFQAGEGTKVLVYQTQVKIPAEHTVCTFEVHDIHATVNDLESRGVTFEEYDLAEYGFEEGGKGKIIEMPFGSTTWFKDPEGNILAIAQRA